MNTDKNESLLDIAIRLMRSKKKPKSLRELTNEVFQTKGVTGDDIENKKSQFQVDFMLSGHFVCCGENSKGLKLWDLKSRQPSTLLDKDGSYLEELFSYDEDVVKNELKDDDVYEIKTKSDDELFEEDTDEDDDTDDIEEELGLVVEDDEEETEEVLSKDLEDEDIDEADDDDLDDLNLDEED
jgi:DNA-directed RNA polymerase delta subunit